VRRIFFDPVPRAASRAGPPREPRELAGPLLVSGGWWEEGTREADFAREYWFTETPRGILWRYRDARTGAVWVQGLVD
jgi:hypothetical protein